MIQYKMLVLTDHSTHSKENSLYALLQALQSDPRCGTLDVASRGIKRNIFFFQKFNKGSLFATRVTADFQYDRHGQHFIRNLQPVELSDYDVIFLRLPHPVSHGFWSFLTYNFPEQHIINRPSGIIKAGDKQFLLRFPELCPPMKLCHSVADIIEFKAKFPVVLKPLRSYGGKGLVRIDDQKAWVGHHLVPFSEFIRSIQYGPVEYLGMRYLKNVHLGDKRIVVVNGEVLGATLRLPAKGSWLCNSSQGGSSVDARVEPEEEQMVKVVDPELKKIGIVMYGLDTLVDDQGQRVLSEINASSIGGLIQMQELTQKPIVARTAQLLWDYIGQNKYINETIAL